MRISYIIVTTTLILTSCNESDYSEIYNENNTSVIDGIVYNINEKPINGLYRTYYTNGNPKMEVSSRNGLPNGIGKFYNEDGSLLYQGLFKNGKLDGMLYQYYPEGSVHNEMNYSHGIYEGSQKIYDIEGNQTAEIIYDAGKPVSGFIILNEDKIELTEDELEAINTDESSEETEQSSDDQSSTDKTEIQK
jgi:hypothetical protein